MEINNFFNDKNHVYIIAEVGQNHDGSLGQAHAFIDACSETGVDAIKFQTHIADAESTLAEPFRVKFSYEDKTRYDYWKRMEFSKSQWQELKSHAEECNMDFLSSPFSLEAVELLDDIGVKAWKVGSGEVFNTYLIERMLLTAKPILLSSGMSTIEDVEKQLKLIQDKNGICGLFQCTTAYPTSFDQIGLNVLDEYMEKFNCPIGLSDHSGTIFPSLAAVARGARMIETHVTLSKYMFGPDVKSSLSIEELKTMVEGVRAISTMLNSPMDKCCFANENINLKKMFSKSIYAKRDIPINTILGWDDISMKKPLEGIPAEKYQDVIGKRVKRHIKIGEAILFSDV